MAAISQTREGAFDRLRMIMTRKRIASLIGCGCYGIFLFFFFIRYVPLVKPYLWILSPVLGLVILATALRFEAGVLCFIFAIPLINNLPYFFYLYEPLPMAPSALILFLSFFLGVLIHGIIGGGWKLSGVSLPRPVIVFGLVVVISGLITIWRYANFFPFRSDGVYELVTNAHGVSAGGAIMSVIFNALNYLSGLLFFVMVVRSLKLKKTMDRVAVVCVLAAAVSLLFGLYQHFFNIRLGNNPVSVQLSLLNATFKDALSFGAYLSMISPLVLGILFAYKGIIRILSFFVIASAVFLSFYTGSKIGFFALLVSFVVFALLGAKTLISSWRNKPPSEKRIGRAIFAGACVAFVALGVYTAVHHKGIDSLEKAATYRRFKDLIQGKTPDQKIQSRAETLWRLAISMIKDYPLTGVGMGGYIIEASNYAAVLKVPLGIPESTENHLLQVGSELGGVGLVLVIWIFVEIVRRSLKSLSSFEPGDKNRFLYIGALAGVTAFFVNAQFHTFIGSYEIKCVFWLLVGILFSFGWKKQEEWKGEQPTPLIRKRWLFFGALLAVVYGGAHLWNSTHSLSLWNRTEKLGLKQDFGFYQQEKTADGMEFRWSREYGGQTIKVLKSVIRIPLLASHPDIAKRPVKVKIFLVKGLFREKRMLGEIVLRESRWGTYEFRLPDEVGREAILLLKVGRTWNPQKITGIPDPRNIGVAIGPVSFREEQDL